MKYLAAYLLLTQGGNESPAAADIKKVIESVGIEADEARINELLSALEGKSLDELIAEGQQKFASVPVGGAAAGGASAAAGGAAAGEAAEEKEEEAAEESDDDMGFGLFD
ncbi:uncharacterized protein GVI51_A03003 [Nakaseomyces glabratus]|uniref:Uncharacterized protein n=1 Tax=Candida glabrata (strain ATCC 2001 / BCRC 20586 / JCM 3761 / NBRC 0622 / NRRL Y-65 / CBS 138) TaxID=284593 RepID=Q6FYB0_CANGA|nr:60S acidic ribosomal protein P2 [Nakaseomyces glabratus]KAH7591433.1 60s Acidic ribosomal protein [Nakaseomyces glabratus]KAH7591882.1 60s Acidic ribosomal protein [Nakaseomyces glabratus]KAH7598913.1 60s Acidic ribosomal protein [Nakaseomyces glabratus]KAH7609360.1 60s Acidic ribosomal protein [Nakaseomyces glabratus]KAH7609769.1 60s Acidic ribosomal protein [Nakaseomyces glabratus]|eukprot:XP_444905.1 60S acidic ribosomal protein P2 [[Candida] glabrata]